LVTKIASVLKKPLFLPKIPEYLLKLFLGDMSAIILESQRVCSKKIKQSGFKFKFHEIGPALENILKS
jgi:NAD dependent epimerase/dehydratase family enzyme